MKMSASCCHCSQILKKKGGGAEFQKIPAVARQTKCVPAGELWSWESQALERLVLQEVGLGTTAAHGSPSGTAQVRGSHPRPILHSRFVVGYPCFPSHVPSSKQCGIEAQPQHGLTLVPMRGSLSKHRRPLALQQISPRCVNAVVEET